MAIVGVHVDNPGSIRHHGQEGVDDVLEAPVVDVQRPLHLDEVLGGVQRGVEVHARVVDQNVDLSVFFVNLVPQVHHTHNVSYLHWHEFNSLGFLGVYLIPAMKCKEQ